MSNVIHASFGMEREWRETREKTEAALVEVGRLLGDDEALVRAKADRVYALLREMVEHIPNVTIHSRLPASLTDEQREWVEASIKAAALKGIEASLMHCVGALMASIFDLCTSRLKEGA